MKSNLGKRVAKLAETLQVDVPVRYLRLVVLSHEGTWNGPSIQISGPRAPNAKPIDWPHVEWIKDETKPHVAGPLTRKTHEL